MKLFQSSNHDDAMHGGTTLALTLTLQGTKSKIHFGRFSAQYPLDGKLGGIQSYEGWSISSRIDDLKHRKAYLRH